MFSLIINKQIIFKSQCFFYNLDYIQYNWITVDRFTLASLRLWAVGVKCCDYETFSEIIVTY